MRVLLFGRYVECPLKDNTCGVCKGKCDRLDLYEEKIKADARDYKMAMDREKENSEEE